MDADLFDIPEGMDNVNEELMEARNIMDQVIRSTFSSRNGKKTLAYMEQIAMQPGFDANMGLLNGIANGFAREGQTALVQFLKMRMVRADKRGE